MVAPVDRPRFLDTAANISLIAAAATFIVLSLLGYFEFRSPGRWFGQEPAELGARAVTPTIEPVEGLMIDNIDQAAIKASGTPKIALIEFSDFQCPYCARHAKDAYFQVQRDFVDTGQVSYVFFNLPLEHLHPLALDASEAAECAGQQGRFWGMHDLLFKGQTTLSETDFSTHARTLGLEMTGFQTCLGGATLPKIRVQMAEAQRAGVVSTPTFLIGRFDTPRSVRVMFRTNGAQPYPTLARALKNALAADVALTQ